MEGEQAPQSHNPSVSRIPLPPQSYWPADPRMYSIPPAPFPHKFEYPTYPSLPPPLPPPFQWHTPWASPLSYPTYPPPAFAPPFHSTSFPLQYPYLHPWSNPPPVPPSTLNATPYSFAHDPSWSTNLPMQPSSTAVAGPSEQRNVAPAEAPPIPPQPPLPVPPHPTVLPPAAVKNSPPQEESSKPKKMKPFNVFPDGEVDEDYTLEESAFYKDLRVHWPTTGGSGDKYGDWNAATWPGGKKLIRHCLGMFRCTAPPDTCQVLIRPQTTEEGRDRQMRAKCLCGYSLQEITCEATCELFRWRNGVKFFHHGVHTHPRPTHDLHLTAEQEARFTELAETHPTRGPLALQVGAHGQSAVDIAPMLVNTDRVRYQRRKVIHKVTTQSGLGFIAEWSQFCQERPDVHFEVQFGEATTICMYCDWMMDQVIPDDLDLATYEWEGEDPVNGFVSDAAHQWWDSPTALLIISSVFQRRLKRWVPVLVTYANGQSAEHYRQHFLCLMSLVADCASKRGIALRYELFAGIADLSQAQHNGFIAAFVDFFFQRQENTQSREQLAQIAKTLMKGCQQHYRTGVTRVSRASAIVPPAERELFSRRANALLQAETVGALRQLVLDLLNEFPDTTNFFSWWLRKDVASMLFQACTDMHPDTWLGLPDTTNPSESMNQVFYASCNCSQKHDLLVGFSHIYSLLDLWRQQLQAAKVGRPIRYGVGQLWKHKKFTTGLTKRQRAAARQQRKRYVNDGRAPDTAKKLLKKSMKATEQNTKPMQKGKKAARNLSVAAVAKLPLNGAPAYVWADDSCWCDTSMQLFYVALSPYLSWMESATEDMNPNHILRYLYNVFKERKSLRFETDEDYTALQETHRNFIRWLLARGHCLYQQEKVDGKWYTTSSPRNFQPVWYWLDCALSAESKALKVEDGQIPPVTQSYHSFFWFEGWRLQYEVCSGSTPSLQIPSHVRVRRTVHRQSIWCIGCDEHMWDMQNFNGQLQQYFAHRTQVDQTPIPLDRCWYNTGDESGAVICDGSCNQGDVFVSLPVLLMFESLHQEAAGPWPWDTPAVLRTKNSRAQLRYQLVGRIFSNGSHFKIRYRSNTDLECGIFEYDGMLNGGYPKSIPGATDKSHLLGTDNDLVDLPGGYVTCNVLYVLENGSFTQLKTFHQGQIDAAAQLGFIVKNTDLTTLPPVQMADQLWSYIPQHSRHGAKEKTVPSKWKDYQRIDSASERPISRNTPTTPKTDNGQVTPIDSSDSSSLPSPADIVESVEKRKTALTPGSSEPVSSLTSISIADAESNRVTAQRARWEAAEEEYQWKGTRVVWNDNEYLVFNCRCGTVGKGQHYSGNVMYAELVLSCRVCHDWSHLACQNGLTGRTLSRLEVIEFTCHICSRVSFLSPEPEGKILYAGQPESSRVMSRSRALRFWPGCGALVKSVKFYYPVRLIGPSKKDPAQWVAVWWRDCLFSSDSPHHVNERILVPAAELIDALENDRAKRRSIRFGRWLLASSPLRSGEERDQEEAATIGRYWEHPFTREVDQVLSPHAELLEKLLNVNFKHRTDFDATHIPALSYWKSIPIGKPGEVPRQEFSSFRGPLSARDIAGILCWLQVRMPTSKDLISHTVWESSVGVAHAKTLLLASRSLVADGNNEHQHIHQAWDILTAPGQRRRRPADVDRHAIAKLEEAMFTVSREVGPAGNRQWGRNVGPHHDHWNPYDEVPKAWISPYQAESLSEDENGKGYYDDLQDNRPLHIPDIALRSTPPPPPRNTSPPPPPRVITRPLSPGRQPLTQPFPAFEPHAKPPIPKSTASNQDPKATDTKLFQFGAADSDNFPSPSHPRVIRKRYRSKTKEHTKT